MKAKINAALIKQLEPKERAYDVRDSDLKGFLIRVNKSEMVYMCEYGRAKRIMIGKKPDMTCAMIMPLNW